MKSNKPCYVVVDFDEYDEIIAIHSKLIQKTGGSDGLRDRGLLESTVYSACNAFEDVE